MGFLDAEDVFALSKVSRHFQSTLDSRKIWENFLKDDVLNCRPLVVDEIYNPCALSLRGLKDVVMRSRYLVKNWERDSPTKIAPASTLSLKDGPVTQIRDDGGHFFVGNYMALTLQNKRITCFRMDTGECISESNLKGLSYPIVVPDCESSSLYFISTEVGASAGVGVQLRVVITRLRCPPAMEASTGKDALARFEQVQRVSVPAHSLIGILDMFCDIGRRRICLLSMHITTGLNAMEALMSLKLKALVVLDWDEKACVLLDTGISGIYQSAIAHFTDDGEGLILFSHARAFHWRLYDIAELRRHSFVAGDETNPPVHCVAPRQSGMHIFSPAIQTEGFYPLRKWTNLTAPLRQYYKGTPSLRSIVYSSKREDEVVSNTMTCRLIQFYVTEDGPLENHFAVDLQNCMISPEDSPLLAVSFNYFAWVSKSRSRGPWKNRLEMMLGSFPAPALDGRESTDEGSSFRKMDVPHDILQYALQIFLVPSKASIKIATSNGKFHTFRYA